MLYQLNYSYDIQPSTSLSYMLAKLHLQLKMEYPHVPEACGKHETKLTHQRWNDIYIWFWMYEIGLKYFILNAWISALLTRRKSKRVKKRPTQDSNRVIGITHQCFTSWANRTTSSSAPVTVISWQGCMCCAAQDGISPWATSPVALCWRCSLAKRETENKSTYAT